jgi:nitrogen fixation NifU-like protein
MLKGKTLEEAQAISNQEIVDILELPAIKIHCSVLAEEAIHRAIDDFKSLRNND